MWKRFHQSLSISALMTAVYLVAFWTPVAIAGVDGCPDAEQAQEFLDEFLCPPTVRFSVFFFSEDDPVATESSSNAVAVCQGVADIDVEINPTGGNSSAAAGCGACSLSGGGGSACSLCFDPNGDLICNTADIGIILENPLVFLACCYFGNGENAIGFARVSTQTRDPIDGQSVEIIRIESAAGYGGVATARAHIVIEVGGGGSWTTTLEGGMTPLPEELMPPTSSGFGIFRRGVIIADTVYGTLQGPCGSIGVNTTFNSSTGDWEFDQSPSGSGTFTFDAIPFAFSDYAMDVNGDGRFQPDDVDELASHLSENATGSLARFDFDDDGVIDSDDVDYMQLLVDAGLDSGTFGDANDDGKVRCDDLQTLRTLLETELCDMGYNIALDSDVDGVIDDDDEGALESIVIPVLGDANGDLVVNTADLGILISQFGTSGPEADFNNDGIVNTADLGIFNQQSGQDCR